MKKQNTRLDYVKLLSAWLIFKYATIIDVIENVPEFLEEVYNKKRLHSSLKYLTPEEFELSVSKRVH